jgi:hypothetical protein
MFATWGVISLELLRGTKFAAAEKNYHSWPIE